MHKPQNNENPQDGHLTTAQVAALLRVSPDTVRRHRHEFGASKLLGRWRYAADRVRAVAAGGTR